MLGQGSSPPPKALLLARADHLASLPALVQRILAEINSEHSTAASVAAVLSRDTPLSARVLRVANSFVNSRGAKVSQLSHAVSRLGVQEVRNIILGATVVTSFGSEHEQLRKLYLQSLAMALATDHILDCATGVRRQGRDNPYFAAALLANIGLFVLNRLAPEIYSKCVTVAENTKRPLVDVEMTVLGYTHPDIGGTLLAKWRLAPSEIEACRWHHAPAAAPAPHEKAAYVVNLAERIADDVLSGKLARTQQLDAPAAVLAVLGIDAGGCARLASCSQELNTRAVELERLMTGSSD